MSWAEIKKAVNSDLSTPLNEQFEIAETNGKKCQIIKKYLVLPITTLKSNHSQNFAVGIKNNIVYQQTTSSNVYVNQITNNVTVYWLIDTNIAPSHSTRTHAIVVNDRYIYIIGGGSGSTGATGGKAYDFDLNASKEITNPIVSSGSWYYHTMVEYNGNVFVLGGNLYIEGETAQNKNVRLNLDSNGNYASATAMNDLPVPFAYPASVVFDNEIHLFFSVLHYKSSDGNTWTALPRLGISINYNKAVVYNDEIHAFDAYSHYKSSDGITWTQLDNTPFQITDNSSVFVAHEKIYVLGSTTNFCAYKDGKWLDFAGAAFIENGVVFEPFDGSESINIP